MGGNSITVLAVAGDSRVHSLLSGSIARDTILRLVGHSSSGMEAIDLASLLQPDVVALDMNLPDIEGIQLIRCLKAVCPAAIVAMGTARLSALEAISQGADDFLIMPIGGSDSDNSYFLHDALAKFKISTVGKYTVLGKSGSQIKLIAVVNSAGGPATLTALLCRLPKRCPPVVIAQHNPGIFGDMAMLLEKMTGRTVITVKSCEQALAGCVYLPPPNCHIAVEHTADTLLVTARDGLPVNGRRPSADVLFRSALRALGSETAAVLLDMGRDGWKSLAGLAELGAVALARNDNAGLRPIDAIDGNGIKELSLEDIVEELSRMVK